MTQRIFSVLAALLLLAAAACAPAAVSRAEARSEAGDLEGARSELERERDLRPDSADLRVALGEAYYQIARDALDREHDEARYLAFLEKSVSEFVTALEIDPRDERPHFYLAVMDTYRGQLREAMRGMNNARRLEPSGVAYTNIGELYVYLGELQQGADLDRPGSQEGSPLRRRALQRHADRLEAGRSRGGSPVLLGAASDRSGAAPHHQRGAASRRRLAASRTSPATAARARPAGRTCRTPARRSRSTCSEREISKEAALKELRIEMEKQRRLQKVYEQRKELEIQIEPEPPSE